MKLGSFCFILLFTFAVTLVRAEAPSCRRTFLSHPEVATQALERMREDSQKNFLNLESRRQLTVFNKYRDLFEVDIQRGEKSQLSDIRFKEIILKTIRAEEKLTAEEMNFIISNPDRTSIYEGLLTMAQFMELPYKSLKNTSQFLRTRQGNMDYLAAKGAKKKAQYLLQDFYNGPLKFMLLIPPQIQLPGGQTPTAIVFHKLWKDPKFEPSAQEWAVLKELKAEKAFRERKAFLNEHRNVVLVRRWLDYVLAAILLNQMVEGINWAFYGLQDGAFVSVETFLNDPRFVLKPNQVRLYNETVPFPHMAIEIDGLVYSYGQTHMTVRAAREYLLSERIQDVMLAKYAQTPEKGLMGKAFEFLGLDKLERSVQTVTLNLTLEERNNLKRALEMNTGKRYRNSTLVMDCASMVVKALKGSTSVHVPAIIDASPSSVLLYLADLKTRGYKNFDSEYLIDQIVQVQVGKRSESQGVPLLRNLYINLLETRFFTAFLPLSIAQRSYLEARHGDDLQYWDPETKAFIASWQPDAIKELDILGVSDQLAVFTDALRTASTSEEKAQIQKHITLYFELQLRALDEQFASPETRFEDIMKSEMKIHYLHQQWNLLRPKGAR